jgi:hypothetical protein
MYLSFYGKFLYWPGIWEFSNTYQNINTKKYKIKYLKEFLSMDWR